MRSGKPVLGLFVLLVGCRQLVGIEQREAFDGGVSRASFPACGLQTQSARCASCMTMNCCAQAQQCVKDTSSCARAEACAQACAAGDSACLLGCSKKWDPVSAAQAQLRDCRASCADACGPWDCLGKVAWQIPASIPDMIKVSAIVKCETCSLTGGADVIAGVRVRVCSIADPECKAELAHGDSDASGNVNLMLSPQGSSSSTQLTPVSVFLEFHKEGLLDSLLLLNTPPLSYDFDVGVVKMDTREEIDTIASTALMTSRDSSLGVVKLRISDCNLQASTGIDVTWDDPQGATIGLFDMSEWNVVAVNLPIPANETTRVVARRAPGTLQNAGTGSFIASVNLVVRKGAITLAPFVTPTP